jgi:tRNA dimethylallyltransferase
LVDKDRAARAVEIAEREPDAVLAVVGPTASGKTELAVQVAEQIGGEIVSADSVQVYRRFDIGSGKPSLEEQARACHHLIDVLDPLDPMDAARFAARPRAALDDIRSRGKRPIVCGGTFLWVKALLFGLAEAPPASEAIRAAHRAVAEADGRPALHARLATIDPASAARLHPNDLIRVSRALEVHELTGEPMSAWQARHGFATERLRAHLVGIAVEPEELTRRITARVHGWLASGWVDEVRTLVAEGFGDARAMGSVGYREVRRCVDDPISYDELEILIVRSTRIFARRQRTWLHHASVTWL